MKYIDLTSERMSQVNPIPKFEASSFHNILSRGNYEKFSSTHDRNFKIKPEANLSAYFGPKVRIPITKRCKTFKISST